MQKVLAGNLNCDIFDEIFTQCGNTFNNTCVTPIKKSGNLKSLLSCIKYFDDFDNICIDVSTNLKKVIVNEELADKLTRQIAYDLAKALDTNSVLEIRKIKAEYGATKEFAKAKDFLNKKCKQIWDVYENKNIKLKLPYEAMKALGVTNSPDLEFLLLDSLKFYEKDNGSTTVDIINSILFNKNLNYTFEDIYMFLKNYYTKTGCKYNLKTVSYLVYKLDFSKQKLDCLGIEDNDIKNVLKSMPVKDKLKYYVNNSFLRKYIVLDLTCFNNLRKFV